MARKTTQNTRLPFSNVRRSGQETDCCQKGREEKIGAGRRKGERKREMEGGKIKQREKRRMEGGSIHPLHTHIAVIMDQPTHHFVFQIILSRSAVCPERDCRDSGRYM